MDEYQPKSGAHELPLPDWIDYWPKWERERYILTETASMIVDRTVAACPSCPEDGCCEHHREAHGPDSRRDLERRIVIEFCEGEATCSTCEAGGDCRVHWRPAIQAELRGVLPHVAEVAEATHAHLFPCGLGYALAKGRRAVVVTAKWVEYIDDHAVRATHAVTAAGLGSEINRMMGWLEPQEVGISREVDHG